MSDDSDNGEWDGSTWESINDPGERYLGASISSRMDRGLVVLSEEFSDGRTVKIKLDPLVVRELLDWLREAGEVETATVPAIEMPAIIERRAPVQAHRSLGARNYSDGVDRPSNPPGTIAWSEYLEAWRAYDRKYRSGQSAERLAERGGVCLYELREFLGREPETFEPLPSRKGDYP